MQRIEGILAQLKQQGMLRSLREIESVQGPHVRVAGRDYLLLCSNNYLGLAGHPALIEASCRATTDYGSGSGASRLVSGSMSLHHRLEDAVADFKGAEAALLFNSGYAANNGIIQGLFGPGDLIFSDELNHASIIDGCRLSGASVVVYAHTDMKDLEHKLRQASSSRTGRFLIVTDGIFSMDGDIAPLRRLVELKEQYDAWLMVDDAHGGGVLGEFGRGCAEELGCLGKIELQMGTFGKAFGSFGAYLAASRPVIDMLINSARSFIFSTSLPPGVAAANLAALEIVRGDEGRTRRQQLARNREIFASELSRAELDLCGSQTQIVPVLTCDPDPTMSAADALLEEGIYLSGIRPPTVPEGTCRLRATLMADHDPAEVLSAARSIISTLKAQS